MAVKEILEQTCAWVVGDLTEDGRKIKEKARDLFRSELSVLSDEIFSRINNRIQSERGFDSLLPENTRFMLRRGNATIFVIEEAPRVRTVYFSHELVENHREKIKETRVVRSGFELAFPYVIFIIVVHNHEGVAFFTYFSNKPIRSVMDYLYDSCLSNTESDGRVCLPQEVNRFHAKPPAELSRILVDSYWKSAFSWHGMDNFLKTASGDKRIESLWEWERQSKTDPTFVLKVKWRRSARIKKIIDEYYRDYGMEDDFLLREDIDDIFAGEIALMKSNFLAELERSSLSVVGLSLERKLAPAFRTALLAVRDELLTIVSSCSKNDIKAIKGGIKSYFVALNSAQTTKGGGR